MIGIYHKNLIGMENEAYHVIYDMLSSFAKKKIDSTKNDFLKKQRIIACSLLESCGIEADEKTYLPSDNIYKIKDMFYSMTHSGNTVYVAVSENRVGIDVEEIPRMTDRKMSMLLRSHFFTENEQKKMSEGMKAEDFLKLWTFKEAFTKVNNSNLAEMIGKADYFDMQNNSVFFDDDKDTTVWEYNESKYLIRYEITENTICCIIEKA